MTKKIIAYRLDEKQTEDEFLANPRMAVAIYPEEVSDLESLGVEIEKPAEAGKYQHHYIISKDGKTAGEIKIECEVVIPEIRLVAVETRWDSSYNLYINGENIARLIKDGKEVHENYGQVPGTYEDGYIEAVRTNVWYYYDQKI